MNELNQWVDGLQLATNEAEPRDEIMLFPFGEFDHPVYGKLKFDNNFFNEIIDNHQMNVLHVKPFMDKQHDEDKALAWFDDSPYIRPGVGLFIKPDYTDLGRNMLKTRTYRYFSPSWGPYKDPQNGKEFKNVLMGGAATNIPFLKTMPPIIDETAVLDSKGMVEFKLTDLTTKGSSDAGGKADESKKEQTPTVDNKTQGENMIKINKLFNLSDDAPEDEAVVKVEDLQKENADLKAKVAELEATAEEKPAEDSKELTEEVNKLKIQLTERDRDDAIKKALTEGRIKPADKEYWEKRYMSDPTNVAQDLDKMPKVVDFSEAGKSGEGEKAETEDPGQKLVDMANELVGKKLAINFTAAYNRICAENPKLVEAYNEKYHA
jgi:phage I-like protein